MQWRLLPLQAEKMLSFQIINNVDPVFVSWKKYVSDRGPETGTMDDAPIQK